MTDSMMGRVARAIGPIPYDTAPRHIKIGCEEKARAAIAAMREPTEAMLRRGPDYRIAPGECAPDEYIWQDMIDAALKE